MNSNQLRLPGDFPEADLEEVVRFASILDSKRRAQHGGQPCDEWRAFVSGYHGVRERFRAMTEAEEVYVGTVPESNETRENMYRQNRALFDFFTNALSVIETLCYACFGLAAQLRPSAFPMSDEKALRAITPKATLDKFELIFPKEPLTEALRDALADPTLEELKDARNTLSHRGNPPRQYSVTFEASVGLGAAQHKYIGGAKGDPPTWHGIRLDPAALEQRRTWLVGHVVTIVAALLSFARRNVPI